MHQGSHILICSDFEDVIAALKSELKNGDRFEPFVKEGNFLVSDAEALMEKAYLTSDSRVIFCLAAQSFPAVVQNKLLKILEEPPPNKEFIILTSSKSSLLPTIRSRLPVFSLKNGKEDELLGIEWTRFDIGTVYTFIQKNKRLNSNESIEILEKIGKETLKSGLFNWNRDSLQIFSEAREALNLGSPGDFVLTAVLLKLLEIRKGR